MKATGERLDAEPRSRTAPAASPAPSVRVGHCWLQKHATPAAADGEFHWYPQATSSEDTALRGWIVEQLQGLAAPAVWWELAPGRLLWASLFAAIGDDGRPYRGVALSVVEGAVAAPELLAALAPVAAGPYAGQPVREHAPDGGVAPGHAPDGGAAPEELEAPSSNAEACALARGILRGGAHALDAPMEPTLPRRLAALWRWLPAGTRGARRGVWQETGVENRAEPDAVATLLATAWRAPKDASGRRARHAWHLTCELAQTGGCTLDEIVRRSDEAATREDLRALLTESQRRAWEAHGGARPPSWRSLLHGFGRGWMDEGPGAPGAEAPRPALVETLAHELALRALSTLRAGGSAAAVMAEARWHALLPADRRGALWRALALCAPSLAAEPLGRAPALPFPGAASMGPAANASPDAPPYLVAKRHDALENPSHVA